MDRPIPAFYCCYLLRSSVRHQSLYVGSTPHAVRRLRQHNGDTKGGAVRTSRASLRPWEMACIVVGFPSKIAALQFEWAWQNTHLTRHIAPDERITRMNTKTRYSPRTGRKITKVTRPRMSLTDRLVNLHILLSAQSFRRWPLRVRFFCSDVFRAWQRIAVQRQGLPLRPADITLDVADDKGQIEPTQESGRFGVHSLEFTYQQYKPVLEHSLQILSHSRLSCHSCKSGLDKVSDLILVCPHEGCSSTYHMDCLSKVFLGPDSLDVLPTNHTCPKCSKPLTWAELVKDLSLRTRGVKEQADLFKVKGRKKRAATAEETAADLIDSLSADDDASDAESGDEDADEATPASPTRGRPRKLKAASIAYEDGWNELVDEPAFGDAIIDARGLAAETGMIAVSSGVSARVVEDSDWDDAEVLD
ncbi:hypothetical protein K461DRAFT_224739 [Myriangium duriaei CBS 260.36]|uniref:GIY-YIG domain-containing protein n=1 Tax=Myriangium duriaei CBS 260.36 TaxID=1168546 RepID=A0A9P4J4L0_9PEZI|nr:hypothetical protein K461DRAFT_224739 [Myriangium duriaei CBS 260.36]